MFTQVSIAHSALDMQLTKVKHST